MLAEINSSFNDDELFAIQISYCVTILEVIDGQCCIHPPKVTDRYDYEY